MLFKVRLGMVIDPQGQVIGHAGLEPPAGNGKSTVKI